MPKKSTKSKIDKTFFVVSYVSKDEFLEFGVNDVSVAFESFQKAIDFAVEKTEETNNRSYVYSCELVARANIVASIQLENLTD